MSTLICKSCNRGIGQLPPGYSVLWTGIVIRYPMIPDGCLYVQCRKCHRWNRYELVPPNEIKLVVDRAA